MGWFPKSATSDTTELLTQEKLDTIRELSRQLAEAKGTLDAVTEVRSEHEEIQKLKDEKAELSRQIKASAESHEREKREIEHKLGLHKQKVEQDVALATEKAKLEVEKTNLESERTLAKEQQEFMAGQFKDQTDFLRGFVELAMGKVPDVETLVRVGTETETKSTNGESKKD